MPIKRVLKLMMSSPSISFVLDSKLLFKAHILMSSINKFSLDKKIKVNLGVPENIIFEEKITKIIDEFEDMPNINLEIISFKNSFDNYPIGNKIELVSRINDHITYFLDTDMMFCNYFSLKSLADDEILLKQADIRTWGSQKEWEYIFDRFSLTSKLGYYTTLDKSLGYSYYNAGFIGISNPKKFGQTWKRISLIIDEDDNIKNKRPWLDQISLPIAILEEKTKVQLAEPEYNYPGHLYATKPTSILVHYHHLDYLFVDRSLNSAALKIGMNLKYYFKKYEQNYRFGFFIRAMNNIFNGFIQKIARLKALHNAKYK